MKAKTTLKDKAAAAVEAAIYPDQREVEGTLLATLVTVINSDVADLKYSLLELTAADFHFRDHHAQRYSRIRPSRTGVSSLTPISWSTEF